MADVQSIGGAYVTTHNLGLGVTASAGHALKLDDDEIKYLGTQVYATVSGNITNFDKIPVSGETVADANGTFELGHKALTISSDDIRVSGMWGYQWNTARGNNFMIGGEVGWAPDNTLDKNNITNSPVLNVRVMTNPQDPIEGIGVYVGMGVGF